MKLAKCLICSKELTSAGMRGHLRFKHDINEATEGEHFIVNDYAKERTMNDVSPMSQESNFNPSYVKQVLTPAIQQIQAPIQPAQLDPFDQVEKQLSQLIRIKSLKQMMRDLDNPSVPVTPQQQGDTLLEVNKIMDLVTKIEERVESRINAGMPENTQPEDVLTLELIKSLPKILENSQLKQQGGSIPPNVVAAGAEGLGSNHITPPAMMQPNLTNEEVIKKVPNYIKTAIKKGELTLAQVMEGFKERGYDVVLEQEKQIKEVYDLIKNKKKK